MTTTELITLLKSVEFNKDGKSREISLLKYDKTFKEYDEIVSHDQFLVIVGPENWSKSECYDGLLLAVRPIKEL